MAVTTRTKRGVLKQDGRELAFYPTAAFAYHISVTILKAKLADAIFAAMAAIRM